MKFLYLLLTTCAMLLLTAAVLGHAGGVTRGHGRCPIVTAASAASLPWHFRHGQPHYGSGLHCQLTAQR